MLRPEKDSIMAFENQLQPGELPPVGLFFFFGWLDHTIPQNKPHVRAATKYRVNISTTRSTNVVFFRNPHFLGGIQVV